MRITLTLENPRHEVRIPLHYNYLLASCIYRTLGASSSRYAERLHQEGYPLQGKRFKPFTFSQLLVARRQIQGDQLLIQSPTLRWCISSPIDEFVMHFAAGILEGGQVRLGDVVFRVRDAQAMPVPTFTPHHTFHLPVAD